MNTLSRFSRVERSRWHQSLSTLLVRGAGTAVLWVGLGGSIGAFDRQAFNLNIQPVVPITGDKWNLIARTIIPVNSVPQGQTDSTFGIGDRDATTTS